MNDPEAPRHLSADEIVAHHEAAHAVIALELGLGILEIGIDLERVAVSGGIGSDGCRLFLADLTEVPRHQLDDEQKRLSGHIDVNGTVLAAGPASDAKLLSEDPWTALHKQHSDLTVMRQLLQRAKLDETEEGVESHLRNQLGLAVEALEEAAVWATVEAVAAAVLSRGPLSGPEIEAIAEPLLKAPSARS